MGVSGFRYGSVVGTALFYERETLRFFLQGKKLVGKGERKGEVNEGCVELPEHVGRCGRRGSGH